MIAVVQKKRKYKLVSVWDGSTVTELLNAGWELYGFPVANEDGVHQALTKTEDVTT